MPCPRVLSRLPEENQVFLAYLMPLFHCIARNEEINGMNSINLAICCAPSLLWPDSGLDVIKNEVPPLVQFMVEHSPDIFGSELPELYKQLPVSPGMVRYIPTKVNDGDTLAFQRGRADSLDTSTSEESAGEEETVSTLLRARRSGLTVSDSQLSVLSHQLDEYEKAKAGRKIVTSREMELDGRHIAEQMEVEVGPPSPSRKAPSPKRQKRMHRPERSNSYRSPSEKATTSLKVRYQDSDLVSRRKSIATQTTLERPKRRGELFPHDFHIIPPSSTSSSLNTKVLGVAPYLRHMESIEDEPEEPPFQYQSAELPHRRKSSQKKRRTPQYSHSFSKESENKPEKPIPTSHSYYDKLLPLDPESRARSRSFANSNVVTLKAPGSHHGSLDESELTGNITWPTDKITNEELRQAVDTTSPLRAPMGTIELGNPIQPHMSTQSINSSRSGSSNSSQPQILRTTGHPSSAPGRHSNLSLASSHSGGSGGSGGNRASPDPLSVLEQTPMHKIDREFVKVAISKRFGISSLESPPTSSSQDPHAPYVRSSSFTSSTPYYDQHRARMRGTKGESGYPHDGNYRDVKKEGRVRANSDLTYMKGFGSSLERKEGLLGVVMENPSFDDRPESEQHLNSLPRPPVGELIKPPHLQQMQPFISGPPEIVQVATMTEQEHEHDPNRLYPGYNSDTESSPSRTLSRPEKLQEVASPPGKSIPLRYKTQVMYLGAGVDKNRRYQSSYEVSHRQPPPSSSNYPGAMRHYPAPPSVEASQPAKIPESYRTSPQYKEVSVASQEKVTSVTRQSSVHKVIEVGKRRAHEEEKEPEPVVVTNRTLGSESRSGVTMVKVRSSESPKAERSQTMREKGAASVLGNASKGFVELTPRQRSKSTSEDEAMRIIHKVVEEPEGARNQPNEKQDSDKTKKYEGWISCAPTSTERRLAWEQRSRSVSKPTTVRDLRSRSLRQEPAGSPVLTPKTIQQPSPSPQQKSATMPELSPRQARPGARRIGMVRTVKITSFFIPEPQRIRRINLRTYYTTS